MENLSVPDGISSMDFSYLKDLACYVVEIKMMKTRIGLEFLTESRINLFISN